MDALLDLDKQALIWINSHHNVVLDAVLAPVAYAGEMAVAWFVLALAMLVIGRPGYRVAALMMIVTIIAVDRLAAGPLQEFVGRPRPYIAIEGIRAVGVHWKSGSFPSGHAHSVWVATVILGSRWPRLVTPLVIFSLLTCYSRPYFGMHYPLDTVAGTVLGLLGGFAAVGVERTVTRIAAARSARRALGEEERSTSDGEERRNGS